MAEKIPAHIREQQINELPNISFVRWDGEYRNSKSKAICRCAVDGHEWSVQASSIINLGKCPKCGRVSGANWRRIPAEERIGQINGLPNISFVRWADEYRNEKSKAVCRCAVDGFEWAASISNLIGRRSGCPQCANRKIACDRRTPSHVWEKRINDMPTVEFVEWVGRHHGCDSKAVFRCAIDGHEWTTTMRSVASSMSGCPQCAGSRRFTAEERMAQINAKPNTEFVRWEGSYKNVHSRAVCRCTVDGFEWSSEINNLINSARGCPACAQGGYNPAAPGTLYALRSECGTMAKIGISNNYKQRHAKLKRATPFDWHCIELLHNNDGAFIAKAEKELHSLTEQAQFSEPFDGYTEWRKWDDRIPMLIEEYRARA